MLGVKGCLNARKDRELTDYARNVSQIADETAQTSDAFFGKLDDPGGLSVTEFVADVNADRSAMDNYMTRIEGLDAPGDMAHAQSALELVYELRGSAMTEFATQMSTALGDVGSEKAIASIANQMKKLLGSDVLYAAVVRPEVNGVLADKGIEGSDVPESVFLPDTKWLDATTVSSALGLVSGATGGATPGVHGLALIAASADGTSLTPDSTTTIAAGDAPEVGVEVQNQGESTENTVTVTVTVSGGQTLQQDISSIAPGETQSVTIPLTPAPSGQVTLDVEVQPVPGERVSTNNEASYTVVFE